MSYETEKVGAIGGERCLYFDKSIYSWLIPYIFSITCHCKGLKKGIMSVARLSARRIARSCPSLASASSSSSTVSFATRSRSFAAVSSPRPYRCSSALGGVYSSGVSQKRYASAAAAVKEVEGEEVERGLPKLSEADVGRLRRQRNVGM